MSNSFKVVTWMFWPIYQTSQVSQFYIMINSFLPQEVARIRIKNKKIRKYKTVYKFG